MKNYLKILSLFALTACMSGPYKQTNKSYKKQAKQYAKVIRQLPKIDSLGVAQANFWAGTTNFSLRKPNIVVIHHTAQKSCEQTLKTFTLERTKVSAHYVICEDGVIHQMLNDYMRAWHGGVGKWGTINDVNSSSIGIELDNDGFEPFSEKQMQSLLNLLTHLKKKYDIPTANFIGHADIAPTRKNDPNVNFDWNLLSKNGFGVWFGDTLNLNIPTDFNPYLGLKSIGYHLKDTSAVIVAFKRKYTKTEGSRILTDADKKILYTLVSQNMNN
ncbi:MAG: N-acetylmuramoyl-L-alanine amidase [Spirosomataceae bacterium]